MNSVDLPVPPDNRSLKLDCGLVIRGGRATSPTLIQLSFGVGNSASSTGYAFTGKVRLSEREARQLAELLRHLADAELPTDPSEPLNA